jgi:Spy/CpxP family protein refolding chaperone
MMTAPGKWKVAAYLTAIFAAGMVSGWVVAGREAKSNPHPAHPPGPGSGLGRNTTNSIYPVGLSSEQKVKVDEIILRYSKMWDARRSEQMNDMRRDSSNRTAELSAVLTPDQREQWEKLRKERDQAWRSGTNTGRGGSNSSRGSNSGEKGERGPRNRNPRERRGSDNANPEPGRAVTNETGAQSTNSSAPPR